MGRIRAADKDVGENAEMYFTIVSGDGLDSFDIFTDKSTQEGVITVNKVRLQTPGASVTRTRIAFHYGQKWPSLKNTCPRCEQPERSGGPFDQVLFAERCHSEKSIGTRGVPR